MNEPRATSPRDLAFAACAAIEDSSHLLSIHPRRPPALRQTESLRDLLLREASISPDRLTTPLQVTLDYWLSRRSASLKAIKARSIEALPEVLSQALRADDLDSFRERVGYAMCAEAVVLLERRQVLSWLEPVGEPRAPQLVQRYLRFQSDRQSMPGPLAKVFRDAYEATSASLRGRARLQHLTDRLLAALVDACAPGLRAQIYNLAAIAPITGKPFSTSSAVAFLQASLEPGNIHE